MPLIIRMVMVGVILASTAHYILAEEDVNLVRRMTVDDQTGIATLGELYVEPGMNGDEAKVKVIKFDQFKKGLERICIGYHIAGSEDLTGFGLNAPDLIVFHVNPRYQGARLYCTAELLDSLFVRIGQGL